MERRTWERIAVAFLALQAVAVLAWWAWMFADPTARGLFVGPRRAPRSLEVFFIPDVVTYIGLGMLALYAYAQGKRHAWPLFVLHTGAVLYATCATFALAYESQGGWLGVGLMVANAAVLLFLAWRLRP